MYGPETTIRDIVSFTGLYEGETYTVEGIVMDKSTGKPLEQNGKKITTGREFTATAQNSNIENGIASGHVEVEFKLDTTKLGGKNIVIFETLKYRGKKSQTIVIYRIVIRRCIIPQSRQRRIPRTPGIIRAPRARRSW